MKFLIFTFALPFISACSGGINLDDAESVAAGTTSTALNILGNVSTIAGTAGLNGSTNATGTAARFDHPGALVAVDGNLYITDYNNCVIRKMVIATGVVTTFAGTVGSCSTVDGIRAVARFNGVDAITSDGTNLFVTDCNDHIIRKIVIATAAVSTIAGTAGLSGTTDATGAAARFNIPEGLATDGTNLYIADSGNATIRKLVIATNAVTTLAGHPGLSGIADGVGAAASFWYPGQISLAGSNLYIPDLGKCTLRKLDLTNNTVSTFVGVAAACSDVDGVGAAVRIHDIYGSFSDGTDLYVTQFNYHAVRKVNLATGAVSFIAGVGGTSGSSDGLGSAAKFNQPSGITSDGTSLYVTDYLNHTIRKIQ